MGDLADKTGQTRQNLSNKMARDNFSEKEIKEMAAALDCEYEAYFVMRDTGEKVWCYEIDRGAMIWAIIAPLPQKPRTTPQMP